MKGGRQAPAAGSIMLQKGSQAGQRGGYFSWLFGLSPKDISLLSAAFCCLPSRAGPGPPHTKRCWGASRMWSSGGTSGDTGL